jgi:hypothetical protein
MRADEYAPWGVSLHRTQVMMGGLVMIGHISGASGPEIASI